MQTTNKLCFLTTAENWPRFMSHETLCLVKKSLDIKTDGLLIKLNYL